MIFVSIGTSDPFDRLLLAAEPLAAIEDVVAQCGRSRVRPAGATTFDFLPYERVLELMREARVVVTHAGIGSVMAARVAGKKPVVVPRLRRHGEAVDDHQLPLARRLHEIGLVTLVEDLADLPAAVGAEDAPVAPSREAALAADLRTYLAAALA